MNKGYYFVAGGKGYKKDSEQELSSELDSLGLEYKHPELGGGPGEVISQVIAYISVKEVWVGVASSIIFESIKTILTKAYQWHQKNKTPKNNIQPIVNIYIYNGDQYSFLVEGDVSKKYTEEEVKKLVEEASKRALADSESE